MLEWLKRHAWKACIRQKRIPGSNPGLSASIFRNPLIFSGFFFFLEIEVPCISTASTKFGSIPFFSSSKLDTLTCLAEGKLILFPVFDSKNSAAIPFFSG